MLKMLPSFSSILSLDRGPVVTRSPRWTGVPLDTLIGFGTAFREMVAVPFSRVTLPITSAAWTAPGMMLRRKTIAIQVMKALGSNVRMLITMGILH